MLLADGLDRAAEWLSERPEEVRVVAVDGQSAAGKSTFADALADRTSAAVVRGDDFYRVMDEHARARLSPREGIYRYYDWPRMRDEALLPLRAGRAAVYLPYDWDSGLFGNQRVLVRPAAVVVVDGLFVSRPELRSLVDLAILVEAPADVRVRRQLARADAAADWLARWDAAEQLFFAEISPATGFELVVCGSGP